MTDLLQKKLTTYKAPPTAVKLIQNTRVAFLVGVTAAGKDTILKHLLTSDEYHHVVSHTTRAPRENHGILERDGVDYHFIDRQTAEAMLDNGGFVEAKQFSGNVYGTSVAEIQMAHDENKIALTDVEVQGVAEYRAISDKVIPIFLLPPDFHVWQERLVSRYDGNADPADIKRRLETARTELREALEKSYFEYVVNEDLDTTIMIVDQVAHGNFSAKKNEKAREIAHELLLDLEEHLSKL